MPVGRMLLFMSCFWFLAFEGTPYVSRTGELAKEINVPPTRVL